MFRRLIALVLILVVAIAVYFYVRMDDEIRRYAERFLAAHYIEFDVRLGSASLVPGRGIYLGDLTISEHNANGGTTPLVRIEQMQLLGQVDVETLLSGAPDIKEIVLLRPKVWLAQQGNQEWNVAKLFPLPATNSDTPADVRIDAATVVWSHDYPGKPPLEVEGLHVVATRKRDGGSSSPVHVEIEQDSPTAAHATATLDIDTVTHQVRGTMVVHALQVTTDLLVSLPGFDAELARGCDFTASADLSATFAGGASRPLKWLANYQLSDGRLALDHLPRPITQIFAQGTVSPKELKVEQASAMFGKAELRGACNAVDWQTSGQYAIRCQAKDLTVDNNLHDLLPVKGQCLWDRFRPAGVVDVVAEVRGNPSSWQPDVTVTCRAASFEDHEKFRYRLEQASGQLRYWVKGDEGQLTVALDGSAMNRPVRIRGELSGLPDTCGMPDSTEPTSDSSAMPPGWLEIDYEQMPIHERFLVALPPSSQETARSLSPTGKVSVVWRIERGNEADAPIHTHTTMQLHDLEVRYTGFPYPLTHINGTLTEDDGVWTIREIVSQPPQQGRTIQCSGRCVTNDDGVAMQLFFRGTELPLDDQLRIAMPENLQHVWNEFRPSGRVNFASHVSYRTGDIEPTVSLVVAPHERSVSILPESFPLRLERCDGTVKYENGVVTLENIRAMHGRTSLSTQGKWSTNELGGWRLDLERLSIDRLTPSRDLMLAAPPALWKVIDSLKPDGSFAVQDGRIAVVQPSQGSTQFATAWDVKVDCHQADLDVGIPLDDVSGMVQLVGRANETGSFTDGELSIDSAFWQGIQITNIRGPLRVEKDRTALGMGASKLRGESPRRIEAELSGGRLALDAFVQHDGRTRYNVTGSMSDVDFGRLMREQFHSTTELSGKLSGEVTLGGTGRTLDLMEGGGRVKLTEARIGELNFMVSLLKVLRNRSPNANAFDTCEAVFGLSGRQIKFDELNLLGDAVSLYGRGEANFDRELDLVFHSLVGRNDLNIPVLRSLMGSASEQIMQIEVDGTFDNPITHRKALPGVSSLIEQIGGEGISPTNPENASRPTMQR